MSSAEVRQREQSSARARTVDRVRAAAKACHLEFATTIELGTVDRYGPAYRVEYAALCARPTDRYESGAWR